MQLDIGDDGTLSLTLGRSAGSRRPNRRRRDSENEGEERGRDYRRRRCDNKDNLKAWVGIASVYALSWLSTKLAKFVEERVLPALYQSLEQASLPLSALLMGNSSSASVGERLIKAATNGDISVVMQIAARRHELRVEDLEAKNRSGRTPLLLACKHGHPDLAIHLIKLGSNVNAVEEWMPERKKASGNSVLHYACKLRNVSLVSALMEKGANPFIWNSRGASALDVARHSKNWEVASVLQQRLVVKEGWVLVSSKSLWNKMLGFDFGGNSWKRKYCMVLQSGCPDILEIVFFDTKITVGEPSLVRTFHVNFVHPPELIREQSSWLSGSSPQCKDGIRLEVGEWIKHHEDLVTDRTRTKASAAVTISCDTSQDTQQWLEFFKHEATAAASRPLFINIGSNSSSTATGSTSSGAGRRCPLCTVEAGLSDAFCKFCGAPLITSPDIDEVQVVPTSGRPIERSPSVIPSAPLGPLHQDISEGVVAEIGSHPDPSAPRNVSIFQPGDLDEDELVRLAIERSLSTDIAADGAGLAISAAHLHVRLEGVADANNRASPRPTENAEPSAPPAAVLKDAGNQPQSQEQKDKDDSDECLVCFEASRTGICVPCGHNVACVECLIEVKEAHGLCPYCRQEIREAIRLYKV